MPFVYTWIIAALAKPASCIHSCVRREPGLGLQVADSGNFRIQTFTSSGQFITAWGAPGHNDRQFSDMIRNIGVITMYFLCNSHALSCLPDALTM